MGAGVFHHLVISAVAVCAFAGLPPAARADGASKLVLVEQADVGDDARLAQISSLDLHNNRIGFPRGLAYWALSQTNISDNPILFPRMPGRVPDVIFRRNR